MGSVMWRKRPHAAAPSTSAASITSRGTVCSPARKITIRVPKLRHTAITTSVGRASVVESSQPGPSMPTQPSSVLTRPPSSRSRNFHTTETATMLVTTGR